MLIKQMTFSKDFDKSLRLRRLLSFALLGVGLVGMACYFLLVPGSSLSDYAQGFYLGAASGVTLGAVILLVRTQYLLTHPQAKQQAKIKENDERERRIVNDAFRLAGIVTFFTAAAVLFIILPLNTSAFYALLGVMALYSLSFAAANLWLSKTL